MSIIALIEAAAKKKPFSAFDTKIFTFEIHTFALAGCSKAKDRNMAMTAVAVMPLVANRPPRESEIQWGLFKNSRNWRKLFKCFFFYFIIFVFEI